MASWNLKSSFFVGWCYLKTVALSKSVENQDIEIDFAATKYYGTMMKNSITNFISTTITRSN